MTLVQVGRLCTLVALAIVLVVVGGSLRLVPKFGSPSVLLVTAILFSVVGRGLRRRGKAQA